MMKNSISIIGVPMALGQSHRGVDLGPTAIRYANLVRRLEGLGYIVYDQGNLIIPQPKRGKNEMRSNEKMHHLQEIVRANERLAKVLSEQITLNRFPLILGGDHSIALGTFAGLSNHYENLGLIWFDAHGDSNTDKTTPSGNIHGMSLAASLGFGHEQLTSIMQPKPKLKPEHTVLIGVRDLDLGEKKLLNRLPIKIFTMHDVDRLGMANVVEEAIHHLRSQTDGVHLSFDLDVIDPMIAPGVGTKVPGGLSDRESHLALEMIAEANIVTSAEFVEVNPLLDEQNKTACLTVDLIESLFGKTII